MESHAGGEIGADAIVDFVESLAPFESESRFETALKTWDPIPDSPLLNWIDPVQSNRGRISFGRVIAVVMLVCSPPILLCLSGSETAGGGFFGPYGMERDVVFFFANCFLFPALLLILLYGRRLLGDMINRVKDTFDVDICVKEKAPLFWIAVFLRYLRYALRRLLRGIISRNTPASGAAIPVKEKTPRKGGVLRAFECLSRVGPAGSAFWLALFMLFNLSDYVAKLRSPQRLWLVSPIRPQTFFYPLRLGNSEPNFAGVYTMFVLGPLVAYVLVLLARLIVQFTRACVSMAKHLRSRIMPAHPDGAGGLLRVGRVALFLSLPIMVLGLSQTLVTLQELFIWRRSLPTVAWVWWLLYLGLCPLLFLLPLLPLRRLMYASKQEYLSRLETQYRKFDIPQKRLAQIDRPTEGHHLAAQDAIIALMGRATDMSVWPFDRKTLRRFVAVFLAPLLPLLGHEAALMGRQAVAWLLHP